MDKEERIKAILREKVLPVDVIIYILNIISLKNSCEFELKRKRVWNRISDKVFLLDKYIKADNELLNIIKEYE